MLLISCQSPIEKPGDFKLLPLPQEFENKGISALKYDDILLYYALQKNDLPVCGDLLHNILPVEKQ